MRNFRFKLFITILALLIIFSFSSSIARVGGGESYGGGSSSGGGSYGGGGGGDGDGFIVYLVIRLLIWLIIECPVIGVPLTIIIIIAVIVHYSRAQKNVSAYRGSGKSYSNYGYQTQSYSPPKPYNPYGGSSKSFVSVSEQIRRYKKIDTNFSRPLFMDFVQLLYTKIQLARGDKNWSHLVPYMTEKVLNSLKNAPSPPGKVEDVIIGQSNIGQIGTSDNYFDRIIVNFEANYKEYNQAKSTVYYVKERWILQRKKGVLSKGPEDILALHCPSCGSPVEIGPDGKCPHCDNIVNRGDFHWQVFNIIPVEKYPRPPLKLGGGGVETGTDLPDVVDPAFASVKRAFQLRYPNFSGPAFEDKVRNTFMKLQKSWSENNWEAVRSLETDPLFASHRYWIERYKAEGLRNILENIEIISIRPVKIEQDAYYESMTVRIKAKMLDYTINKEGKVVSGNKNRQRTFSEYWTFIRRAGFADDKKEKKKDTCPNCGGPIQVSMAGICEYCGGKVTSGEFDWILSIIEQDEAYEG